MRVLAILVLAAACSSTTAEVRVTPDAREPSFEVTFVDRIDGQPATHLAIGGRMRVKIENGPATWTSATGPFVISASSDDTLVISAVDQGTGQIEIETATGFARFTLTSAAIARVELRKDCQSRASVALLDAIGKRLVDTSLRVAGGSAPVTFVDAAWDRIEVGSLPNGIHQILVKTDLMGATSIQLEKAENAEAPRAARRSTTRS